MLTDEPMTETPTLPEPVLDGPVIASPGSPDGIVQSVATGNGQAHALGGRRTRH